MDGPLKKQAARVPWVYIWFLQKPRGTWIRKKHERSTVLETSFLLCYVMRMSIYVGMVNNDAIWIGASHILRMIISKK